MQHSLYLDLWVTSFLSHFNNTAINILLVFQFFLFLSFKNNFYYFLFFRTPPTIELLDLRVTPCLIVEKYPACLLSKVVAPVYKPTSRVQRFPFLHFCSSYQSLCQCPWTQLPEPPVSPVLCLCLTSFHSDHSRDLSRCLCLSDCCKTA